MKKAIITISRQYGSGGREVAEKLAKALDIPFYDNELISLAAEKSGINAEEFRSFENIPGNNILYSLSMLGPSTDIYGMPLSEKVYEVQSNVIKEIVKEGPCVLIGRCADYVLRDYSDCIKIFVTGSLAKRVNRAVSKYNLLRDNAEKKVLKVDKSRETYYNYHTGQRWGNASNYDLVINTDNIDIDSVIKLIMNYIELKKDSELEKPIYNPNK